MAMSNPGCHTLRMELKSWSIQKGGGHSEIQHEKYRKLKEMWDIFS